MKVCLPFQDLHKGEQSVLSNSFGLYERKGLCPSGWSGEGHEPSQDLVKGLFPSLDLHEVQEPLQMSALGPSFDHTCLMTTKLYTSCKQSPLQTM